jgi:outer membrane biosynthesis protein TonB
MAQRAEASAPATTNAPSERVQYTPGALSFGAGPAQAQSEAKPETKPDAQANQASAEPAAPPPPQTTAAVEPPKPIPAPVPQATKPVEQQASTEPASSPDNAYAKARDSDVKRAASERRRVERRERWAERRRYDTRDARGGRDQTDWDDIARNVRADSDTRDVVVRRPRAGFSLFGPDDD